MGNPTREPYILAKEIDIEEAWYLDGTEVTPSASEFNAITSALGGATITIGTEAANEIDVVVQLTDVGGTAMAERCCITAYLSDDANGDSVAATAPDADVVVGTDGLLLGELTADKVFQLVSEADGDIDLTIGETGVATWYLIIVLPNGHLVTSDAITFA